MKKLTILSGVLLAACAKPGAHASSPTTTKAAGGCRVLVDYAGDPTYDDQNQLVAAQALGVADVRLGPTVSVKEGRGAVVRSADGKTFVLRLVPHHDHKESGPASLDRTWTSLEALGLPIGSSKVWFEAEPDEYMPGDSDQGDPEASQYEETHAVLIAGIVGPYVSLWHDVEGFTGGAHGYDESGFSTVSAPNGAQVDVSKVLGGPLPDAVKAKLDEENRDRQANGDDPIDPPDAQTLAAGALTFDGEQATVHQDDAVPPLGLFFHAVVSCCSWAENHNMFDLAVPVEPPAALAPFATVKDGMVQAPDGCGAVALDKGELVVQSAGAAPQHIPLAGKAQTLLGVIWLAGDDPFDVAELPAK